MSRGETKRSLWVETTPGTEFPALDGPLSVDVAVVGGGIAGVTAAVLLKRAGKTVALLDFARVLTGATGYTTAKVTSGHGVVYSKLAKSFGEEGARLYAEANEAGLARIAQFVEEEGIDCDFERKPNYVYAEEGGDRSQIEDEVKAAKRAGLDASLATETPLPYPVAAAVRLEGQAQFHPRKYLLPLAHSVPGDGSHVLEQTRVQSVRGGRVRTDRGEVRATDVILASHLPFMDRGLFFAKAHPHRSYAVAARIDDNADPQGMYLNSGTPTRSVRTARDERGLLLLVGGEGHKPGKEPDTESPYRTLEDFARRHWGVDEFPYRWSTMDYMPVDGVPYVGRLTRGSEHVLVATGFQKWGMTNGTAAAMVLADRILGRDNPWADLYDSKRMTVRASAPKFVKENAAVASYFFGDRAKALGGGSPDSLAPGDGAVMRVNGRPTAVCRDGDGTVHAVSPVCTHLGCHVSWNKAESSWDCPCHGSRFAADGTLLHGPATKDLKPRSL